MEFIDLATQQRRLSSSLQSRISAVLEHGLYILGPEVAELEEKLAAFVGTKYCVGVANGTDALQIAMMALGIEPGDEIITTSFTFAATVETILVLGAKPVFADIDPDTYTIDPTQLEALITPKTKAILPVSLYGQCSDHSAIDKIATKYRIPVIEDAAQSFGAMHRGKKSCNLSLIATTSFFPSKPLGCYGDGGACFTNDEALAKSMKSIRVHGQQGRYYHTLLGLNSRLDTLQAAILLTKMEIFEEEVLLRQAVADRYSKLLGNFIRPPLIRAENTSVYAQYTVEVGARDQVQAKLQNEGIPTAVHYPRPLHQQPVFKERIQEEICLPVAELASQRVMSLPMHPYLDSEDQERIAEALCSAIEAFDATTFSATKSANGNALVNAGETAFRI